MSKGLQWRRTVAEGVVILGSILLAFGLQAWWEGRTERVEERAALSTLLEEAMANRTRLDVITRAVERDYAAASSFFEAESTRFVATPVEDADRILQGLWRPNRVRLLSGALNGLAMSGQLSVIGDADLRGLLADWFTDVASLEARLNMLIELELATMRALATHVDIQSWLMTRARPSDYSTVRVEAGATDSTRDEFSDETLDLRAVRDNVEAMAAASAIQFQRQIYLRTLGRYTSQLDELIGSLRTALR